MSLDIQQREVGTYNSTDFQVKFSKMLKNWYQKSPQPNWEELLEALEKTDMHHLADNIREMLFQGSSTCS